MKNMFSYQNIKKTKKGFTLIEMLISIALLSITSVLVFRLFGVCLKNYKVGIATIDRLQRVRFVADDMSFRFRSIIRNSDYSNACSSSNTTDGPYLKTYTSSYTQDVSSAIPNPTVPANAGEAICFNATLYGVNSADDVIFAYNNAGIHLDPDVNTAECNAVWLSKQGHDVGDARSLTNGNWHTNDNGIASGLGPLAPYIENVDYLFVAKGDIASAIFDGTIDLSSLSGGGFVTDWDSSSEPADEPVPAGMFIKFNAIDAFNILIHQNVTYTFFVNIP